MRADYDSRTPVAFGCRWDAAADRPKAVGQARRHERAFGSPRPALFDPLWARDSAGGAGGEARQPKRVECGGRRTRLYLRPELVT